MLMNKLIEAAGNASTPTYVEDVFSTYLYTGTGAAQTITNGIDLSTKGGLVWLKNRGTASSNLLYDTTRGAGYQLASDLTAAQGYVGSRLTAFTGSGYTIDGTGSLGVSGENYASWTFRKAPKFFDIVTYTGVSGIRTVSHNLGCVPGMIIVKRTDTTGNWTVYHKSIGEGKYLVLNQTVAGGTTTVWGYSPPTSSVFTVDEDMRVNTPGGTYVAYLFADSNSGGFGASGTDSIVACGSFTTDASFNATVNLGWEPQFLLVKASSGTGNWVLVDTMRGFTASNNGALVYANLSNAEQTSTTLNMGLINSTGFSTNSSTAWTSASTTYIYLAIRRGPMKTPTDATKVFSPITSSAAQGTVQTTGFPVDMQGQFWRAGGYSYSIVDRLRGVSSTSTDSGQALNTSSTGAEAASSQSELWNNTGFSIPAPWAGGSTAYHNFRRATGFFDVVCYTGTGSATTVAHNLGVAPELMIVKSRTDVDSWVVYSNIVGNGYWLALNLTNARISASDVWNTTDPTSSVFTIGTNSRVNTSSSKYVAYLFATCPGVSKVGSYTGNGSSQTINCGFAAGARFVLIKRTDSTGDWYVWDTARGIVSANDPHLSLNTTAAEVTTDDTIDPDSSGFIVNQVTATNVNVSSATYIYLAIA